jgi:hypothetical protein
MTTFDDREQAFEKKFAHDAEIQFKVEARARNRLCLWAANQMGKTGDEAVEYAKAVLQEWMKPGGKGAVERIMDDIKVSGAAVTEAQVKAQYVELLAQTKAQVMEEDG